MTNSGYYSTFTSDIADNSTIAETRNNVKELYDFFLGVKLSESRDIAVIYLEISDQLRKYNSPRFGGLADDMQTWVKLWGRRHGYASYCDENMNLQNDYQRQLCTVQLIPKTSISSNGPSGNQTTCAIFTLVRNEKEFLPLWVRYYSRHAAVKDMWILDHATDDNSTHPGNLPPDIHIHKLYVDGNYYLRRKIEIFAAYLLRLGYRCYLYTDVDEFVIPDPFVCKNGLREYLEYFLDSPSNYSRALGKNLLHYSQGSHPEPPFSWEHPVLDQRRFWSDDLFFSKTVMSKISLTYAAGFHSAFTFDTGVIGVDEIDPNLILLHLNYLLYYEAFCKIFLLLNKNDFLLNYLFARVLFLQFLLICCQFFDAL